MHYEHDDATPERAASKHLHAGNMNAVVRIGDTIRRPAGPWTPTIHRLLRHLRTRGIGWVPEPLGITDDGREVLSYLPGSVPRYPMPSWVWSDVVLLDAAARLAAFHDAGRDFDATGGRWQLPAHQPVEVVCHNDFAPHNLVFGVDHAIVGVIDCDVASPGPRVWDLAHLAYAWFLCARQTIPMRSTPTRRSVADDSRCCASPTATALTRVRSP